MASTLLRFDSPPLLCSEAALFSPGLAMGPPLAGGCARSRSPGALSRLPLPSAGNNPEAGGAADSARREGGKMARKESRGGARASTGLGGPKATWRHPVRRPGDVSADVACRVSRSRMRLSAALAHAAALKPSRRRGCGAAEGDGAAAVAADTRSARAAEWDGRESPRW